MSEPKRYHHFIKFYSKSFTDVTGAIYCYPDAGMIEDKDGKYVEYEDYARLKSLCDNLGMGGKHTITAIDAENARFKAEAGMTFRRLVLDHAGKTIEFVAKPLHDELAAELRFSESRVAMLRAELERREERIRALVEEYSKR
jgi:hypothetical protein